MAGEVVNKVVVGGVTKIDLTSDTVTAADVVSGKTLHLANGTSATGTLADGDLLEYGTPRLVDLAGTTWHFNDSIDFAAYASLTSFWGVSSSSTTPLLESNSADYIGISVSPSTNSTLAYRKPYGNATTIYNSSTGWVSEDYRICTFYSCTGSSNSDLIDFMYNNATIQQGGV